MAVSDLIPTRDNKNKPSAEIQSKIARGRARLESLVPKRNECLEFWRNNPYVHVTQENVLVQTPTAIAVSPGQGRPPHKVRLTRNIILDVVAHEVSAATQRVPSYEINPSTNDPEDIAAASVAEKVALFGYDKWDVRRATVDAVTYAVVADEGFVWPYFDNTKGKVIDPKQGICEGEICLRVFGPNEVYWEPGTRFHDSPWHCVEQARPLESVQREFDVKELKPDATTSTLAGASKRRNASKMVLQTDYLERPTPKNKTGKRVTVVNGKVMKEEAYPCWQFGPEELVLHRLSYFTDPDSDRDMGLVRHLLDAQRTILDCVNKECVAGETLITTREGLRRADEIAGAVDVLAADGVWRGVDWGPRGTDQLWRVDFDDGNSAHVTANHRWLVRRWGKAEWVTTPDLQGESVPFGTLKAHTPVEDEDKWLDGVRHGLVWGDGTVEHHVRHNPVRREYAYGSIRQYGSEDNVALLERFFPGQHTERREYEGRSWIQARGVDPALKSIPAADEGFDYLRGFLAGAIASDGYVGRSGVVGIAQSSREDLEEVATLARTVGISHRGIRRSGTGHCLLLDRRSFVDDSGADPALVLKPYHRANIEKRWATQAWRRTPCRRVVSVTQTDRVEETFCCSEPVTGAFVLGSGLITGNSEWKNLALNPQVILQNVVMDEDLTDEPGAVYHAYGSGQVVWRQVPPVPADLQRLKEEAKADIGRIAAQNDIPNQIDTAAGLQVFVERDQNRRQEFLANLADFHSRVMRSCLYLVSKYYTEKRLLEIRGDFGWEFLPDFRGSRLPDQMNVRVLPGSLAPKTRAQMQQQVQWFAQTYPGWLQPEDAWAAINGGWMEDLIQSYEKDQGWAAHCIQLVRGMADQSTAPDQIPVARDFDNHPVQLRVIETFMKSMEYSQMEPGQQEALKLLREQHKQLEAQDAAEAQMQQVQTAEQLGMANATKGSDKPMPSLQGGAPAPGGTPNGGPPPPRR